MRQTDWSQYGTECKTCGAAPFHTCLNHRISPTAQATTPRQTPHTGRRVTVRKPYPREAAVKAAAKRNTQHRSHRLQAENWVKRGYQPSDKRRRQISRAEWDTDTDGDE